MYITWKFQVIRIKSQLAKDVLPEKFQVIYINIQINYNIYT